MDIFSSVDYIDDRVSKEVRASSWSFNYKYSENSFEAIMRTMFFFVLWENRSTYSFIHSVRRNKILLTRAYDLFNVHTNLRLVFKKSDHYLKGETNFWDVGGDHFDPPDGAKELE